MILTVVLGNSLNIFHFGLKILFDRKPILNLQNPLSLNNSTSSLFDGYLIVEPKLCNMIPLTLLYSTSSLFDGYLIGNMITI